MNSGPMLGRGDAAHLVTVSELVDASGPICGRVGPNLSRCMRRPHALPPCGALGTDGDGEVVVVVWYRPDAFPIIQRDPGE